MKEKLIEILGLGADATEAQIISAVSKLKEASEVREVSDSRERQIQRKIAESGGALNREGAIMALEHQEKENARGKKKPAAK